MGFLDGLKSIFGGGEQAADDSAYWLYVRCRRCGEIIRSRIDLRNDLSLQDSGGYAVTKTLVGSRLCFQRIEVTLTFDENRRLIEQEISGGDFATAEAYQAAEAQSE